MASSLPLASELKSLVASGLNDQESGRLLRQAVGQVDCDDRSGAEKLRAIAPTTPARKAALLQSLLDLLNGRCTGSEELLSLIASGLSDRRMGRMLRLAVTLDPSVGKDVLKVAYDDCSDQLTKACSLYDPISFHLHWNDLKDGGALVQVMASHLRRTQHLKMLHLAGSVQRHGGHGPSEMDLQEALGQLLDATEYEGCVQRLTFGTCFWSRTLDFAQDLRHRPFVKMLEVIWFHYGPVDRAVYGWSDQFAPVLGVVRTSPTLQDVTLVVRRKARKEIIADLPDVSSGNPVHCKSTSLLQLKCVDRVYDLSDCLIRDVCRDLPLRPRGRLERNWELHGICCALVQVTSGLDHCEFADFKNKEFRRKLFSFFMQSNRVPARFFERLSRSSPGAGG
eukprot:TRINITY_DN12952_c0_g1_i1.p1 TRINITY_DN12952_c0_g1~~TRINITY_DN12952_c0_g1_i1.p1  ORF type:complete len:394 (-),score=24.48 TRINITY_DN12952_c0_g1_i1:332-1513(-)